MAVPVGTQSIITAHDARCISQFDSHFPLALIIYPFSTSSPPTTLTHPHLVYAAFFRKDSASRACCCESAARAHCPATRWFIGARINLSG